MPGLLRPVLVVMALLHLSLLIQPIKAFVHRSGDTSQYQLFSIFSDVIRTYPLLGLTRNRERTAKVRLDLYETPMDDGEGLSSTNKNRTASSNNSEKAEISIAPSQVELELMQRVTQLEQLVSTQQVQIRHLLGQVNGLSDNMSSFNQVIELLREAGRTVRGEQRPRQPLSTPEKDADRTAEPSSTGNKRLRETPTVTDPLEIDGIFSSAPSSVMDAADAAGASILAGLLGGKQRMLVDVRDAELSFDPENSETMVQFLELAILPVAAGLEGLRSKRNRLKIVFPTVSQLLIYRRAMALAAPEVVALRTLGFDPVEKKDNLVVIVGPSPDDEEGLAAMNELLRSKSLTQPVVVINHHMIPVSGPASSFDVAYHLRLLSVQFMAGNNPGEYFQQLLTPSSDRGDKFEKLQNRSKSSESDSPLFWGEDTAVNTTASNTASGKPSADTDLFTNRLDAETDTVDSFKVDANSSCSSSPSSSSGTDVTKDRDDYDALEAAMKHAHQVGIHRGVTRAMVIRAYPQQWYVFVDTSPDTDADFEVAALFDVEPTSEEVNLAIIECLEGSEREDELVAQEMQKALELGQLDRISEILADLGMEDLDEDDGYDESDDDDDDDPYMFGEDTV